MQKTAKKFLSMLLALMMVLSILPTAVFATEQGTVAAPLDSIVPYGANDQTTGTATISVQNSVTFTGYSAFENVPYYLVTVPAGTTYVKATYKDAAILTNATSGVASGYYADVPQWTGGGVEMAYTESGGDITITIPLNYSRTAEDGTTVQKSFVLGADGSGTAYAPEYDGSASYAPVHFLAFTYEGKSAPTVAPGAIATANVTLGNAWTLDVAEMFTDADGDALTYTATVNGATQTLNGSTLSYTPTAAGEYTIVLTATDDSGTATHTIVLTAAEGTQVPRLKSGVPVTASATVSVGYAYNLSDLQAGNIFENPDGSSLSYTDYYYYRTAGTGERKGPYYFSTALFGATTIQITENTADTYVYEFHAMNSAGLSTDTWTLTLTVSDSIEQHYTFHVGQDMNYSTNGSQYPLIKLYKTAGLDDKGADYLASYEVDGKTQYIYEDHDQSIAVVNGKYMITVKGQDYELKGYSPLTFKASDFTTADPNSTGTLADNYNNFYASLAAGRYSFRAYGYKASETSANVYLGGHSLTLPTETNVDGGTGGGVVAYANYTNISGVVSDVDITVTRVNGNWSSVGGVAGRLVNSNATNCGNEGTIRAYQYVGGITGYATGTITGCYNGGAITGNGYVAGIVGQTTKGVTACYNTGSITGAGNYVAGIVAFASGASASVKNCYNRAYVESTGSNVGAVVGMTNNASAAMSNLYYLDFTCSQGIGSAKSTAQTATAKTRAEMTKSSFVRAMNTGLTTAAFVSSRYSPALSWQTNLKGLKTPKVGNVDMDPFGYVDSKDVELLRKYLANTITLNDDQLAQANVNGDTVVNQADLDLLEQYVAGTITVFPVG